MHLKSFVAAKISAALGYAQPPNDRGGEMPGQGGCGSGTMRPGPQPQPLAGGKSEAGRSVPKPPRCPRVSSGGDPQVRFLPHSHVCSASATLGLRGPLLRGGGPRSPDRPMGDGKGEVM